MTALSAAENLPPALTRLHNATSALIDPKPMHHHGRIGWTQPLTK